MTKTTVWYEYRGSKDYIIAFGRQHGRCVQKGNYFYYEDGAIREGGEYGQLIDPPSDPLERQKAVVSCLSIAAEKSARMFYHYKDNYAIHNCHDDEIVATLKQLQQQVVSVRKELKAAEGELLRIEWKASSVAEARKMQADSERRSAEYAEQRASEEAAARGKVMSIRI